MIEAMACGTPTIAFRGGSVAEVIDDGVSGFIVDTVEQAVDAVRRISALSRYGVRECFERRFTADRMARDYLALYHSLAGVRLEAAHLRRAHGEPAPLNVVAAAGD